ncbi:hypothetical protein ACFQX8_16910 [Klenkia terrae]|uniref:hypothetical protein n=1 Tax=Klenkia terrae TaxID=1052259 RepID=UPI00361B9D45
MFRALAVHNFRLYVGANLVSMTGTWMQRIGQDWLVLQLSGAAAPRSAWSPRCSSRPPWR